MDFNYIYKMCMLQSTYKICFFLWHSGENILVTQSNQKHARKGILGTLAQPGHTDTSQSRPRHTPSPVPKETSKVLAFFFGGRRLRRQLLFLDGQRDWALWIHPHNPKKLYLLSRALDLAGGGVITAQDHWDWGFWLANQQDIFYMLKTLNISG